MYSQEEAFVPESKIIRPSLFSPLNARQFDSWGGEEESRLISSCAWARATYYATGGANSST